MQVLHKAILQYLHLGYITKSYQLLFMDGLNEEWIVRCNKFLLEETLIINSKMFK